MNGKNSKIRNNQNRENETKPTASTIPSPHSTTGRSFVNTAIAKKTTIKKQESSASASPNDDARSNVSNGTSEDKGDSSNDKHGKTRNKTSELALKRDYGKATLKHIVGIQCIYLFILHLTWICVYYSKYWFLFCLCVVRAFISLD